MKNPDKMSERELRAEVKSLRSALGEIMWQKDCGCDGRNESGEYVNFPGVERDAMYEVARKALNAPL